MSPDASILWALALAAVLATWAISAIGIRVRWALFIVLCFLIAGLSLAGLIISLQVQDQHQRSVTDDLAQEYPQ